MLNKNPITMLAALCLLVLCAGCGNHGQEKAVTDAIKPPAVPPELQGTVAEVAVLSTGGNQPIEGYCLVVGLGKNGSSEVPPHVAKYLNEYLRKFSLGSPGAGTKELTPERIMRDPDTGVVQTRGVLPPAAPSGATFDILVNALPGTQTKSLEGGYLMDTEMRSTAGGLAAYGRGSAVWAVGNGQVFLSPYLDPTKSAEQVKLRSGRVIGGGKVLHNQPVRLQLYQTDYGLCSAIVRRINTRFGTTRSPVATGRSGSIIEISIPAAYRADYEHFLQLVMHLPLAASPSEWEAHSRRVAVMMESPTSRREDLALIWEAMGKQVLPVVRGLYPSASSASSFYAARTGVRMEDDVAGDVLIRMAAAGNSPFQMQAIEELGKHPELLLAGPVLRRLLDDDNEAVRLAAYHSLLSRGDRTAIQTIEVGAFKIDLVTTTRQYVIYATQSIQQRIAVFGPNVEINHDVFFESPDEMLTITAHPDQPKLQMYRRIPQTGGVSSTFETSYRVSDMLRTMGSRAEQRKDADVAGLGLTYSQVVAALYRLCRNDDIHAKFVLQPLPGMQKIYEGPTAVGRPDMAGQ